MHFSVCLLKCGDFQILETTGVDIIPLTPASYSASSTDSKTNAVVDEDEMCIMPSLHSKAEQAKKQLTYQDTVTVSCVLPKVCLSSYIADYI